MKRILFVDDESRVLDGLQRMLRTRRQEWECEYALGGGEALVRMAATPFDVIVTDMRMPELDGAELLQIVHDRYPNTIRIVLSGQTDTEAALRTVGLAHQFLLKPCDQAVLAQVITRVCALQGLLNSPELIGIVGGIAWLPTTPALYGALTQAVSDPSAPISRIVEIVSRDPAISAKVLQLVNSAFFGRSGQIGTLTAAVSYLGVSVLRAIVLSEEVLQSFGVPAARAVLDLDAEQMHAVVVANIAQRIGAEIGLGDEAFIAGMLHDVGKLILAGQMPDTLSALSQEAMVNHELLHLAEQRRGAITHAELGAYLLGLWGLPYSIVEAVAHHHAPSRVDQVKLDLIGVVHIADALVREATAGPEGSDLEATDFEYITRMGQAGSLDRWRAMVREQCGREEGAA